MVDVGAIFEAIGEHRDEILREYADVTSPQDLPERCRRTLDDAILALLSALQQVQTEKDLRDYDDTPARPLWLFDALVMDRDKPFLPVTPFTELMLARFSETHRLVGILESTTSSETDKLLATTLLRPRQILR